MVSSDESSEPSSPGLAWLGAVVVALLVAVVVWRGAMGRAMQLQWAWGIDGGYFLQRIWQGATDPFAARTIFWDEAGDGTYGGRHHSPIVSMFVPGLALRPQLSTLLAMQAACIGAGVLPLFAFCWRCTRDRMAALALLVAAVSVPGFLAIGVGDFRLLAPALVLVPATVFAAVFGPWTAAFAATVVTCAVREEVAPLLIALLPLLVTERAARAGGSWREHWTVPVCAVALPALLWQGITMWRADLLQPGSFTGFAGFDVPPAEVPLKMLSMLLADVRGEHTQPPRLLLRLLALGGLVPLLLGLRPWAVLGVGAFWVGACVHAGVVNPGQVHYYAALVGLYVALVPLALGRVGGRRLALGGAAVLLVVHALLPPGPVSVREALEIADHDAAPEWELVKQIAPDEVVLASGWLLPLVPPRQEVFCTSDFRDSRHGLYARADVAFLMVGEAFEDEIRAAGFVEVARANQGMLLRRPAQ